MKNVWKKAVSLALVLGMTLSIGIVSSAAGSPDTKPSTGTSNRGSVTADKTTVNGVTAVSDNVKITAVDEVKYASALNLIRSTDGLKAILGDRYREGTTLRLLSVVDVEAETPCSIGFNVQGVVKGDTIYVLHFDGEKWEVITPDKVDNEYVAATFTSLSPVAFVKAIKPSNVDDSTKSPKTGVYTVQIAFASVPS